MICIPTQAREQWESRCTTDDFNFYRPKVADKEINYWIDDRYYLFQGEQVDTIEHATNELHAMVMGAIGEIIQAGDYQHYALADGMKELIEHTWRQQQSGKAMHLYGRFDLAYNGESSPKLLEYNADTPTALLEAAVVQRRWAADQLGGSYEEPLQFNRIQEALVQRFREIRQRQGIGMLALIGYAPNQELGIDTEDWDNISFIARMARQAGIDAECYGIDRIASNDSWLTLDESDGEVLPNIFKLYPWEQFMQDGFGEIYMPEEAKPTSTYRPFRNTAFFEPAWKLLSAKPILPYLWQRYAGHPNLLESYFEDAESAQRNPLQRGWVRKPVYGREGCNTELVMPDGSTYESNGVYGEEGYIVQRYAQLATYSGRTAVVGSWVIGDKAAGIGVREDASPITTNLGSFVPHIVL